MDLRYLIKLIGDIGYWAHDNGARPRRVGLKIQSLLHELEILELGLL